MAFHRVYLHLRLGCSLTGKKHGYKGSLCSCDSILARSGCRALRAVSILAQKHTKTSGYKSCFIPADTGTGTCIIINQALCLMRLYGSLIEEGESVKIVGVKP